MTFVIKSHESISSSWQTFARQGGKISTAPLPPRGPRPFKSRTSEATTIKEQKARERGGARGALRDTGRRAGNEGTGERNSLLWGEGVWKMREGGGIRINIKWNCKGGEWKVDRDGGRKERAGDNVKCI